MPRHDRSDAQPRAQPDPPARGFLLGHVSSVELVSHTNAASTGTKMPRANWNDISRYEVGLPSKQLAADYTEKISPLIERIIANKRSPIAKRRRLPQKSVRSG